MGTRGWFQRSGSSSFELLLAEGDLVKRYDRSVLQGNNNNSRNLYSALSWSESDQRRFTKNRESSLHKQHSKKYQYIQCDYFVFAFYLP